MLNPEQTLAVKKEIIRVYEAFFGYHISDGGLCEYDAERLVQRIREHTGADNDDIRRLFNKYEGILLKYKNQEIKKGKTYEN